MDAHVATGDGATATGRRGAVSIRSIVKNFGATPVLRDVSLDIRPGEFVTILGPSGCGKSTLLRIIAGLETQDAGTIAVDGLPIDTLAPDARDMAMVFQSYALYPHLTVADNIAVPLRMRELGPLGRMPFLRHLLPGARAKDAAIADRAREVAHMLRIEDLLARKPAQLSGGQKQRVAVARAMVRQPRVFLMDEPLSNLDAALRVHMRTEIVQLHRRLGTTFLYVTHDQVEAMTMSDRVVVMMDGRPLQFAPPADIYADPADLRIARFVGSPPINILPGRVTGNGITCCGVTIPLSTKLEAGTPVLIGIRPNRVTFGVPGIAGSVTHGENLGADFFAHAAIPGVDDAVIVRCDPAQAGALGLGEAVTLALPPEHVLVFDAAGRRVRGGG